MADDSLSYSAWIEGRWLPNGLNLDAWRQLLSEVGLLSLHDKLVVS